MINTSIGGALVKKDNIAKFRIEELDNDGQIIRIQEDIPKGEVKMEESEFVEFEPEAIKEEKPEVTVEDIKVTYPDEYNQEPIQEPKMTEDPNKINEKFQSFREKFLDLESKADSFENEIVDKMAKRVDRLKSFSETLDKENDYLEEFKKEKLG